MSWGDNLPPGVYESDIPGNRPEDAAWEKFVDDILAEADELGLTVGDCIQAWKIGVGAVIVSHALEDPRPQKDI